MKNKKENNVINTTTQIMLPVLSLSGQFAISIGHPLIGLIITLLAQPFWIYSSYKAYREAKQLGLFINVVLFTIITIGGIVNYSLQK